MEEPTVSPVAYSMSYEEGLSQSCYFIEILLYGAKKLLSPLICCNSTPCLRGRVQVQVPSHWALSTSLMSHKVSAHGKEGDI
jgi:hypothetical protein